MFYFRLPLLLAIVFGFPFAEACCVARAGEPASAFERDIAPLLRDRCVSCHSGPKPKGQLDLTRRDGLIKGGATGPALVPGRVEESLIYQQVLDRKMPPKRPLDEAQVAALGRWIKAGASWEGGPVNPPRAGTDWWSLQPIRQPIPPQTKTSGWGRNPIDSFVLAKLTASNLEPAPEADRRTYIRRVTMDLTGLLPTPSEVDDFLRDRTPDAYERLVDRLLGSPAYGERWARHWLDVVRFAESHGYEQNTLRPNAWPYRDYVIRAFNEDRPFVRFVREQLAGDVAATDPLGNAATGFLVAGPHDLVGNATKEGELQKRMDDLADMVGTTATTFLGLTVGCARCHDHKFDPISQKDFYSLQAVFSGVRHADRPIPGLMPAGVDPAALRRRIRELEVQLDQGEPLAGKADGPGKRRPVSPLRNLDRFEPVRARFVRFTITATLDGSQPCLDEIEVYGPDPSAGNLALAAKGARATASSLLPGYPAHRVDHLNNGEYGNSRSWISNERRTGWAMIELPKLTTVDRVVWGRDREGRYTDRLATGYHIEVSPDAKTWTRVASSTDRSDPAKSPASGESDKDLRKLLASYKSAHIQLAEFNRPPSVYAGSFQPSEPTHLLNRGDPLQPGAVVSPGVLASIATARAINPALPDPERRLALADWIGARDNPLPARVMVNRVWHWHFGQGLVRTPSDFGFNGDRPSHPELLDWLATEFLNNGGRLKPLHRLIVLSATYRQSSRLDEKGKAVDAENRLLWRFAPKRLEAEAIRDTTLQVSGSLNRTPGGPGYDLWNYSGYVIVFTPKTKLGEAEFRRMIYQFKPRLQPDATFGAFDCPDATASVPRRVSSTTALQALNLLNAPFVLDQCDRMAARLKTEAGSESLKQINLAFDLAFNRPPSETELAGAIRLVEKHGLPALCRALFNANEFLYRE